MHADKTCSSFLQRFMPFCPKVGINRSTHHSSQIPCGRNEPFLFFLSTCVSLKVESQVFAEHPREKGRSAQDFASQSELFLKNFSSLVSLVSAPKGSSPSARCIVFCRGVRFNVLAHALSFRPALI